MIRSTRYRFFAGKGGVGKTTCAVAYALARARAGERALLISTDPAPSVADALRQPLSSSPRPVKGTRGRLHAVEVDAATALDKWLRPRRAALETMALRGTWLDEEDITALLRLSLPGIDELAALMEIGRLGRSSRYDRVIVDTAPTGHTLRMLVMPGLLRTLAEVFDRMQAKHRAMVAALRGAWTPEESDTLIAEMDAEGRDLAALLRDRQQTATSWVTLPEPMAIAESADGLRELRRIGVHVDAVLVNQITPAPDRPCRWCRARRTLESAAVLPLLNALPGTIRVATIEARSGEPRGPAALARIASEMDGPPKLTRSRRTAMKRFTAPTAAVFETPESRASSIFYQSAWGPTPTRSRASRDGLTALPPHRPRRPRAPSPERAVAIPREAQLSLMMFGGKGGVGKTTCAAAAAIAAAAARPERPVLLLSSDPAHSLGDVLGVTLGDDPRRIAGAPSNLRARELDAAARFESIKTRYGTAIEEIFQRFAGGSTISVSADQQALRDLMELAPPGLDELMAIVEVSDALDESTGGGLVVLDTAPSGHALRLLEMPALVHEWVKALMSITLKYQPVVGIGELGTLLLQMSRGLGRLRGLLGDPVRAAFIAVSRPAALPMAETRRLIGRLHGLGIDVPALIVNAVGAGTCGRCARMHREQQRAVKSIRTLARKDRPPAIIVTPAVLPPPQGPRALHEWRTTWTST